MSQRGEWIANCRPDRVQRISSASIFNLRVGPPRPNQLQTMEGLESEGIVGLYRVGKKQDQDARADQERYLAESEFLPSPESLRDLLGDLGPSRTR
ncbi:MAG: hypothetical protein V1806_12995 [Pseudomonadota bacterium]